MPTPHKPALKVSFRKTMDDMQQELNTLEGLYSRLVHSTFGRLIGTLFGRIFFRPRSLLIGGSLASITLAGTYLTSHLYDIPYSSTEHLIAFVFGWCIGFLYDLFFVATKRHQR